MARKTEGRRTVLVVGGGYAGVLAANRIAGLGGPRVRTVLVSDRDELVHRIRLHEVAAGRLERRYPLETLLRSDVTRVQGRVTRIDASGRHCAIARGGEIETLAYDHVVLAVGSAPATSVPGARERGMALADTDRALAFARDLRALPAGSSVVVVGGGLGGLEAAAEIAEAHTRLTVTLICEQLVPGWTEELREATRSELGGLGVALRERTRVVEVAASRVVLDGGEAVPAAALVWCTGFRAPPLAADSGLPTDALGRLLVDETLRVPGHPEIVGCGDAVAPPDSCAGSGVTPMRMACATAMPMAAHAAEVVLDAIAGRPPLRFRYRHTVQCVSLGRRRGMLVSLDADDRPTGRVLSGRRGAVAKELICRFVLGTLRLERHVPGLYTWPGRGERRRLETRHGSAPRTAGAGSVEVGGSPG